MMGTIHALNGVVIGIIILQTSVVAPSVFRVLGEEHAGKFSVSYTHLTLPTNREV